MGDDEVIGDELAKLRHICGICGISRYARAPETNAMSLPRLGGHLSKQMRVSMKLGKKRKQYADGFKAGAVRLVLDEGRTASSVARDSATEEVEGTGTVSMPPVPPSAVK